MFKPSMTRLIFIIFMPTPINAIWGLEDDFKAVDSVSLFKTKIYIFGIYSRHGGGKTFLFK